MITFPTYVHVFFVQAGAPVFSIVFCDDHTRNGSFEAGRVIVYVKIWLDQKMDKALIYID